MKIASVGRGRIGGGLGNLWKRRGTRSLLSVEAAATFPMPTRC